MKSIKRSIAGRFLSICLLLAGTCIILPGHTYAAENIDYSQLRQQLHPVIERKLKEKNIVGLSLALVDGGSTVWSEGFGFSDQSFKKKTTPNTEFRVGSVTKLFTAVATMQLQGHDLIDIDQPLSAYLERFLMQSRFSDNSPITVRNILTHHAGIPTDLFKGQWNNTHFTEVVEQLRNEYVSYPPEFVLSYSNIGFSLLGNMIEEVSQQSYESYIQENIAIPLNMPNTGFHLSRFEHNLSDAFNDRRKKQSLLPIRDLPSMGIYSSANDLARFISLFIDRENPMHQKILSDASVYEMLEHQNADIELDFDEKIGLAWLLDRCGINNAGRIAEHGGTTMFYSSQLLLSTEHELGVIVMANTQGSRNTVNQIAETILQAALNTKLGLSLPSTTLASSETPTSNDNPVHMGGDYMTNLGLVSIDPLENELCACSKRKILDLIPQPDGWFNLQKKNESRTVQSNKPKLSEKKVGDQKVIVLHSEGRTQRFGSRMPEAGIPETWKRRLGNYRIINSDRNFPIDHVCLLEKNERLYLGYRMPRLSVKDIHTPLAPITHNEAVTVGLGRTRGETIQIDKFDDSAKEYLIFSGLIAEKIPD